MKRLFLALLLAVGLVGTANAGWVYVGSWNVHDGPDWPDEPQIYTGREAAALLFGGSPADYAISTQGSDPNLIDFQTWISAWGGGPLVVGQDLLRDLNGDGLYNCCDANGDFGNPGDYSAFVRDWCFEGNCINYAFRVPEPTTTALLALGLAGLAATRRRRR